MKIKSLCQKINEIDMLRNVQDKRIFRDFPDKNHKRESKIKG